MTVAMMNSMAMLMMMSSRRSLEYGGPGGRDRTLRHYAIHVLAQNIGHKTSDVFYAKHRTFFTQNIGRKTSDVFLHKTSDVRRLITIRVRRF